MQSLIFDLNFSVGYIHIDRYNYKKRGKNAVTGSNREILSSQVESIHNSYMSLPT